MGISKMQGTYGHIEYIGEKRIKKYSCKNCYCYLDGVCSARKIALNYSESNGRICSFFDPIDKFVKEKNNKSKNNTNKTNSLNKQNVQKSNNANVNSIINSTQISRSKTKYAKKKGKIFISQKSTVYLISTRNFNKRMIVKMCDKNINRELFSRLLDKPLFSTILYKDVIYNITDVVNGIVK